MSHFSRLTLGPFSSNTVRYSQVYILITASWTLNISLHDCDLQPRLSHCANSIWLTDVAISQMLLSTLSERNRILVFQVWAVVSLWTRDPAGSMRYAGTTTPRLTPALSSGSVVARATATTLNLKPTVNIHASSRNRTRRRWGLRAEQLRLE